MLHDQIRPVREFKYRPPSVPPGLVQRPELATRLTAAAELPLTLVCAGPGAGKTLTVASWAASPAVPDPVAWLSLDSADKELLPFWSDLIRAVVASGAVPADSPLRDVALTTEFGSAELPMVLSRLADLPRPIVLVLDDFQEVTDRAVLESFGQLVGHAPTLRLILITRADPVLRLHRLRVARQLAELRADDLAFTEPETAELFRSAGLDLDATQVSTLRNRTEGWPAGLRLAAMSLDADDVQAGIDRFSGTDRAVADYLIGEVSRVLPAADRDFLLATSVVDRISGSLADELTGRDDGQQVLERFVDANAFVVALGDGREWFRFHPLLHELMQQRLALERPRWKVDLHRRAAAWMIRHADPIEAIRQWIHAGDQLEAGRALLVAIPRMLTSEAPVLAAALRPLADLAPHTPSLAALLAAAVRHYHRREYRAMLRDAEEATAFLDEAAPDLRPPAEVAITVFKMVADRASADSAGVARMAGQIIDLVDHTPRPLIPAGRAFRAIASLNSAGATIWTGPPGGHEYQLLEQAATEAAELGLPLARVNAESHLAVVEAMLGRCRAAHHRVAALLELTDRHGWGAEPQTLAAWLARALVDLARLRPASANEFLRRGLAASRGETDRAIRLALAVTATLVSVSEGDVAAAVGTERRLAAGMDRTPAAPDGLRRWAAVAGAEVLLLDGRPAEAVARIGTAGEVRSFATSWERVCLARAHLVLGDLAATETLIAPLLRPAEDQYVEPAVAAWLLQAVIATRRRRDSAAMSALVTALDLAQPEDIRRPFPMIGATLTPALIRYQNLGTRHQGFVTEILRMSAEPATDEDGPLIDALTERELAVLRYLPTMLKAGEIAVDLVVSVNTVKAHLRSIYRKLGVTTRREAVDRARSMGLL